MAEKIYLQFGSDTYATDQTIWYKAIVTDAEQHLPTEFSGVLYIDLIDPHKQIVSHKLVKLDQGIGKGFFDLQDSYVPGRYLIRAYTQWNLNFGDDFMFKAYVDVYGATKDKDRDSVGGLTVAKKGQGKFFLNNASPDVRFFPESGKIVHGFQNKIGFKAVGPDGKGKAIRGAVFDAEGNQAVTFKSNSLGMGFFFMEADSGTTYHAKLYSPRTLDSTITYPLPKVVSSGSILSVTKVKNRILVKVASNSLKDRVYVKAVCRGVDRYLIEGHLQNGYLVTKLPADKLPEGIIVFTLLGRDKKPMAERLFFNVSDSERLHIALEADKDRYVRREKTELGIRVAKNDSIPPNTDLSVMVINRQHWHQGRGGNIRSYFLLGSELRGEVENPAHYFNSENPNRSSDLDALLLTQGWRNYKYPIERQGTSFFWPQQGLTVKGRVRSPNRKKSALSDIDITMATFGKETAFYARPADSMGRFRFLLDDAYGQRMKIWLQTKNAKTKKMNYTLLLDTLRTPKVVYEHRPSVQKLDSVVQAVVEARQERVRTEAVFDSLYGVTQLEEVVVEGYRVTPEREKAYKRYGEPDIVIQGDIIRKKVVLRAL